MVLELDNDVTSLEIKRSRTYSYLLDLTIHLTAFFRNPIETAAEVERSLTILKILAVVVQSLEVVAFEP